MWQEKTLGPRETACTNPIHTDMALGSANQQKKGEEIVLRSANLAALAKLEGGKLGGICKDLQDVEAS